jgi:hypothetical protein
MSIILSNHEFLCVKISCLLINKNLSIYARAFLYALGRRFVNVDILNGIARAIIVVLVFPVNKRHICIKRFNVYRAMPKSQTLYNYSKFLFLRHLLLLFFWGRGGPCVTAINTLIPQFSGVHKTVHSLTIARWFHWFYVGHHMLTPLHASQSKTAHSPVETTNPTINPAAAPTAMPIMNTV